MFKYDRFNLTEPKRIYLSRPNKHKINQLNGITSARIYVYLQDIWKIDFELDKYINQNINPLYDNINPMMEIYVPDIGWFRIDTPPTEHQDGERIYKNFSVNGIETQLNDIDLVLFHINCADDVSYEMFNESLDAQKDLYDYQKKVAEQTKNIAELQKQLSVYEQDLSEETKAKVQQIKVSLEEAQDNLKETQYDQYITDQKKLLDDLYTEYEDTLNSRLDNLDALIIDMVEKINMNADGIKQTLISESANVGYVLTDEMQSIWNTESADGKVLTTYMGNFNALSGNFSAYVNTQSTRWTSLQTTLGTINANIGKLVTASGQQASSNIEQTTNPSIEATGTPVVEKPAAPTPTPEPVQEEKVITVGGMINAGGAPIYSYAGSNKAYKQYFSDDPVYTVVKEQDGYLLVRHHKATSGLTGWFKKSDVKAYKKGGLVDYTGLAQLDGTPSEPEMVLNSEDTKNLIELKDDLKEIRRGNIIYKPIDLTKKFKEISTLPENLKANFGENMVRILTTGAREFHVPEIKRQSLSFGDINCEFHIAIDHVENYDDFVNKMRKDPKVEKMVQAMTVDQMMGRSKLGKYYV